MERCARHLIIPPLIGFLLPTAVACCYPGVTPLSLIVTYCAGVILIVTALRMCPWRSYGAYLWLLAMLALLTAGAIINVNWFTTVSGGYLHMPVLLQTDARRLWEFADVFLSEGYSHEDSQSIPTALLFACGVRDVFVAIMVHVLAAVLAIIVTGQIAWRMTRRCDVSAAAIAALSLMCYFMAQATILIKDVPLALGMALSTLTMLDFADGRRGRGAWILVVGLIIISLYRSPMLLFVPVGATFIAIGRRDWRPMVIPAAAAVTVWCITALIGSAEHTEKIVSGGAEVYFLKPQGGETAAGGLVDSAYPTLPWWRKLLMLPATTVMQFLIPFPWTWAKHLSLAPTSCVAHMGFTWYMAGGVLVYWLCTGLCRSPRTMACVGLWGVAMYLAVAYQFGGRVSRYCLPLLPLLIPAVAYTVLTAWRARSFRIWMTVFVILMAAVLAVCHHISPAV